MSGQKFSAPIFVANKFVSCSSHPSIYSSIRHGMSIWVLIIVRGEALENNMEIGGDTPMKDVMENVFNDGFIW